MFIVRFQKVIMNAIKLLYSQCLFIFIAVMQNFTALKKAREQFRAKLMDLICQSPPGEDRDEFPSGEEKNMLRYYYYLRYGIDSIHVAPLDQKIIKR